MTTETLEGRALDAAVARVLGVPRCECPRCLPDPVNCRRCGQPPPVDYSDDSYSGFAPVEAWLEKEAPDSRAGTNLPE